jgi:hypothetical protein
MNEHMVESVVGTLMRRTEQCKRTLRAGPEHYYDGHVVLRQGDVVMLLGSPRLRSGYVRVVHASGVVGYVYFDASEWELVP